VRALGADKVVDYHTQRFEDEVNDADAALDLVGGADAREAHMMLEGRRPLPRGKIILSVEAAGEVTPAD